MKVRNLIVVFFIALLSSCGNDAKEETLEISSQEVVQDSIPTLQGEFIFLNDAAVLKGPDFIYGVQIDSISLNLAEQLEPLKKDNFDMIPVEVKAKIIENPRREGWDEIIEIREVLKIPVLNPDSVVNPSEEKE